MATMGYVTTEPVLYIGSQQFLMHETSLICEALYGMTDLFIRQDVGNSKTYFTMYKTNDGTINIFLAEKPGS